jgi:predicted DNA-binding ribbon-helix-helix protein
MKPMRTFSAVSTADGKSCRNPRSPVLKRAIRLAGNKTSISLENQFWDGLHEIARNENIRLYTLIERIDTNRTRHNLSSAVRLFVLDYFKTRTSQQIFPNTSPQLPANRTAAVS